MRVLVSLVLCLSVTFSGCATRVPKLYQLSPAGIGLAVRAPPPSGKLKKGAAAGSTTTWSFPGLRSARFFAFTGYVAITQASGGDNRQLVRLTRVVCRQLHRRSCP